MNPEQVRRFYIPKDNNVRFYRKVSLILTLLLLILYNVFKFNFPSFIYEWNFIWDLLIFTSFAPYWYLGAFFHNYVIVGELSIFNSQIRIDFKDNTSNILNFHEIHKIVFEIDGFERFYLFDRFAPDISGTENKLMLNAHGKDFNYKILCRNKGEYNYLKRTAFEVLKNSNMPTEIYEKGKRIA